MDHLNYLLFIFLVFVCAKYCDAKSDIFADELKCEYLINPLAIESSQPRLSWIVKEYDSQKQNLSQNAYQILVASNEDNLTNNTGDIWDTGKVISNKSTHIKYSGSKLTSKQKLYWKVRVWDQNDVYSDYSYPAKWEMGLIAENDWSAQWIGAPHGLQANHSKNIANVDLQLITQFPGITPALFLRRQFSINSTVKTGRVYATARGLYYLYINGKRVGDSYFAPGWTNYNKTILYQTYDVTNLLVKGSNVFGAILGTGWYSGLVGYNHKHGYNYGVEQQVLVELHIEDTNNQFVTIGSDNAWKVTTGPIIYSDMLMGEVFYQNRTLNGWLSSAYNDSNWNAVIVQQINKNISLVADKAEPIRVTQELTPKSMHQIEQGVYIFDFGQNMVGWVRLKIRSAVGPTRIKIRHAEVINTNGSLYTLNLRAARATDVYVLDYNMTVTDIIFEPCFTYHGFRFVEITGYTGELFITDVIGRVMHSDTAITGKFESSNKMVNQLWQNILWGQRGNFFSVPTDCPQRDERIGWMGDAQVFAKTAIYNADVAAFYTKWLRDVREAQSSIGGFSDFAPRYENRDGAPAWADAGVIIPYQFYTMYGDVQVIEENYAAMAKYIEYIESANTDFIWKNRVNRNRGDHLNLNATTPPDVLATAYFAYDALLMSKMAKIINRTEDSNKYLTLYEHISDAFNNAYVNSTNGVISGDTQTDYLLALSFGILPTNVRTSSVNNLVENIKNHNWHLNTGFVGVGYLCPTLTENGRNDVAYRLLLSDTYPSWGYSIKMNATTVWERWDGYTQEKGFQDPSMNSFNHYSLGSVGSWLYQYVAGIDTDSNDVGFKKVIIKPNPNKALTYVKAEYKSIHGLIKSYWNISGEDFLLNVTIAANTRATVDLSMVSSGDVYEIGSGSYQFKIKWQTASN